MTEVIAGVEIPDTRLVSDATAFVRDTENDLLYDHSRRVFLFGSLQGQHRGLKPDPELLYVGAMFHDVGLTPDHRTDTLRFEVDSANAARQFLRDHDVPEHDVPRVWLGIALHTTPGVPEFLEPEGRAGQRRRRNRCARAGLPGSRRSEHRRSHPPAPTTRLQATDSRSLHGRHGAPAAHHVRHHERRCPGTLLPRVRPRELRRHHPQLRLARVNGDVPHADRDTFESSAQVQSPTLVRKDVKFAAMLGGLLADRLAVMRRPWMAGTRCAPSTTGPCSSRTSITRRVRPRRSVDRARCRPTASTHALADISLEGVWGATSMAERRRIRRSTAKCRSARSRKAGSRRRSRKSPHRSLTS